MTTWETFSAASRLLGLGFLTASALCFVFWLLTDDQETYEPLAGFFGALGTVLIVVTEYITLS